MVSVKIEFEVGGKKYVVRHDMQFKEFLEIFSELIGRYPNKVVHLIKLFSAIIEVYQDLVELEGEPEKKEQDDSSRGRTVVSI